jgi:hypothetical protein
MHRLYYAYSRGRDVYLLCHDVLRLCASDEWTKRENLDIQNDILVIQACQSISGQNI